MTIPYATWQDRQRFGYYVLVRAWLESLSAQHVTVRDSSVLDVGCLDTPTATWGWFGRRYTVDVAHDPRLPGVQSFIDDFMTWEPPHHMTVVTCLQVLEHLPNGVVHDFAYKLRHTANYTIVSVPFLWKKGFEPSHTQDPIDLAKISDIMQGEPTEHAIIKDTKHLRLVGLWQNNLIP